MGMDMKKDQVIEQISQDAAALEKLIEKAVNAQLAAGIDALDVGEIADKDELEEAVANSPLSYEVNKRLAFAYLKAELATHLVSHYGAVTAASDDTGGIEVDVSVTETPPPQAGTGVNVGAVSAPVNTQPQASAEPQVMDHRTLGDLMKEQKDRYKAQEPYQYPVRGYDPYSHYMVNPKTGLVVKVVPGSELAGRDDLLMLPQGQLQPAQIKHMVERHNQVKQFRQQASQAGNVNGFSEQAMREIAAIVERENQAKAMMGMSQNATNEVSGYSAPMPNNPGGGF